LFSLTTRNRIIPEIRHSRTSPRFGDPLLQELTCRAGLCPAEQKMETYLSDHSVAELWEHVSYLIRSSKSELERRCKTDWQATPKDLVAWIVEIERIDSRSTFFRYPDFQRPNVDQEKSVWKPRTPDELQKATLPGNKAAMMLLIVDQNDQVTQGSNTMTRRWPKLWSC
jgi:hypothetical protein